MQVRRLLLIVIAFVGAAAWDCDPGAERKTSSMLEDEEHALTPEDKLLAQGKAVPMPAEPPALGQGDELPSAMLEDLDPPKRAVEGDADPMTLEEPRPDRSGR